MAYTLIVHLNCDCNVGGEMCQAAKAIWQYLSISSGRFMWTLSATIL